MNAIRSGWLAAENKPLWLFETDAVWLGAVDGFLFALIAFLAVFAAMFGLWVLGLVGGGDVKLLAATAAWLGLSRVMLLVWLASMLALFFWVGARVVVQGLS